MNQAIYQPTTLEYVLDTNERIKVGTLKEEYFTRMSLRSEQRTDTHKGIPRIDCLLETAVTKYMNHAEKEVTLVGAIHVGDKEYYHTLQEVLDSHEQVFYESIKKTDSLGFYKLSGGKAFLSLVGKLYKVMKRSGLSFQGDHINKKQNHWERVDTDEKTFVKLINKGKYPVITAIKQPLLYVGTGVGFLAFELMSLLKLMDDESLAFQSCTDEKQLLFKEQILDFRNNIVNDRLTKFTENNSKQNTAVFYGAAHLESFHEHLTENLGYRPVSKHWVGAIKK